jgi:hypothetical protein
MKKILLVLPLAFLASCNSAVDRIESTSSEQTEVNNAMSEELPVMTFEEMFHDFGDVSEGQVVNHTFKFKNEGEGPLIISNAQGSCGCTVPQWPRQPIAPGETGEIKVSFNSQGRAGKQDKRVTLTTNAMPQTTVLNITSMVVGKDK